MCETIRRSASCRRGINQKRVLAAFIIVSSCFVVSIQGFISWRQLPPPPPFRRSWTNGLITDSSSPGVSQPPPFLTRLHGTNKRKNKRGTRNSNSNTSNGNGSGGGFHHEAAIPPKPKPTILVTQPPPTPTPPPPIRIRALQQLSSEPLIFTIDDFVSEEACEALQNKNKELSDEARLRFATLVAGELFAGQWGANDGLRFNAASSLDANNNNNDDDLLSSEEGGSSSSSSSPEGLHVDTNNDSTFRSVTAILYLNDVASECGGATLFPLANAPADDPALAAAQRLLDDRIAHTRGAAGSTGHVLPTQEADASLLERTVADRSRGLRIQPQTGRLCIFFSRTADGAVDARSWHGGERLLRNNNNNNNNNNLEEREDRDTTTSTTTTTEKRILTLFKEVCYGTVHPDTYDDDTSFEAYLAPQIAEQRQALQLLAQSHACFFVPA
jgi:hypothetical protein